MKYLLIFASLLFSIPLLADSSFLSGLNFPKVYEEKGNNQYNQISEKGISIDNFMSKMKNSEMSLGQKVTLLVALSSYYEWAEKTQRKFRQLSSKISVLPKNNL